MKNKYVFILSLTFTCSLLLALFSEGLKSKTMFNKELDKKKNILETIGINVSSMTNDDILSSFNKIGASPPQSHIGNFASSLIFNIIC